MDNDNSANTMLIIKDLFTFEFLGSEVKRLYLNLIWNKHLWIIYKSLCWNWAREFVSTYMLHLPDKKKLEEFMLKEIEEMGI